MRFCVSRQDCQDVMIVSPTNTTLVASAITRTIASVSLSIVCLTQRLTEFDYPPAYKDAIQDADKRPKQNLRILDCPLIPDQKWDKSGHQYCD
jgi:hypothetical protein